MTESKSILNHCLYFTANALSRVITRMAELQRVMEVLGATGVPVLALKGPALAVQAYGDVSLRSYGDVDVLVQNGVAVGDLGVDPADTDAGADHRIADVEGEGGKAANV